MNKLSYECYFYKDCFDRLFSFCLILKIFICEYVISLFVPEELSSM